MQQSFENESVKHFIEHLILILILQILSSKVFILQYFNLNNLLFLAELEDTHKYHSTINWTVYTNSDDDYEWEDLTTMEMKREYRLVVLYQKWLIFTIKK